MINVKIKTKGYTPTYAKPGDAGCDIRYFGDKQIELLPKKSVLIPSGINIKLPEGYEAQVRPRSGLASKGIVANLGTIDECYIGEIGIILFNFSDVPFYINPLDRIAQLVFNKVEQANFIQVEELETTERGEGGFGHTGI